MACEGLGYRISNVGTDKGLSLLHHVQTALGPIGLPFRRVHGHESDHFSHYSAEVNNNNNFCYSLMCPRGVCRESLRPLDFLSNMFQCAPGQPSVCSCRTRGYGRMRASYCRQAGCYMHTYIRTYIHTCIHTYVRTYIHAYIHTYVHTYIYTFHGSIKADSHIACRSPAMRCR